MKDSLSSFESILLSWKDSVLGHLPNFLLAIIIVICFFFLAKIARKVTVNTYSKYGKNHAEVARIVASVIYFFLLFSGIFIALQVAGLERMLTHILAGAGIVGIVAGFAFKDIASNFFAGMLLKFQMPYKVGDWVEIDGNYGVVLNISWMTTSIKTVPGQEVFVPNQIIYGGTFTNFSTWGKRRVILRTGVSYGDDLDHVSTVAMDEIKKVDFLLPDEGIDFYFTDIGGSTYNFMLRFWIKFDSNDDYCKGMNEAIVRIKSRFAQENISIAYPVTTLDFGVKGGVNLFDNVVKVSNGSSVS